jgi:KDO2-lipid IV(A) lauroyltransferase
VNRQRRHVVEDRLVQAIEAAVRPWPRSLVLRVGAGLGRVMGRLARRHVRIAQRQLALSFPEWPGERCLSTARGVYRHLGRILFDILWLRSRPERVMEFVDVEGREHPEAAHARGRGVVYVTAHIGCWEVTGLAHSLAIEPFGVVGRPLDNPLLDARIGAFRQSTGNTYISKRRALPDILRLLRSGRGAAFLIDQNTQEKDGVFIEFFGRPACATPAAATMAVRTGAAVVGGHTELQPNGRYLHVYDPPMDWEPSGDRDRDILDLTQRQNAMIEAWIRRVPEQWLWIHRRWHTQPKDPSALTTRAGA